MVSRLWAITPSPTHRSVPSRPVIATVREAVTALQDAAADAPALPPPATSTLTRLSAPGRVTRPPPHSPPPRRSSDLRFAAIIAAVLAAPSTLPVSSCVASATLRLLGGRRHGLAHCRYHGPGGNGAM